MRRFPFRSFGQVFTFLVFQLLISHLQAIHLDITGTIRHNKRSISNTMPPQEKFSAAQDSAVLSELKETIQSQAREIESLKQQLKDATTTSSSAKKKVVTIGHGGGHGSVGDADEEDVAHYLEQPFYQISFKRVGWLCLFLLSLSMTAIIMETFEHTLERQIELAYFVPMLAGHGGNTGGQSVGTVLSALSAGSIRSQDAPRVVLKEAMSGIMSGMILGSLVAPIAYFVMGISEHVSTVLFFTMPLVSTIAATLGSTIPFICVIFGFDPSVIAAPAMTSFVDVSGLMSYFLIANYIFKLFGVEL